MPRSLPQLTTLTHVQRLRQACLVLRLVSLPVLLVPLFMQLFAEAINYTAEPPAKGIGSGWGFMRSEGISPSPD